MELWVICGAVLCFGLAIERLLRILKIDNYSRRYVLVTGCDSGFGNALARRLDGLKLHVFACCLTKEAVYRFKKESSPNLTALELDVTKDASVEKAMEIVKRTLPKDKGLWSIVNNAGVVPAIGPVSWQTIQDYENTFAVNLYGVIRVTNAFMPLILREKGRVVNISSVAGRVAILNASYTVSKYGVEAFSDILRRDNYRKGVSVHILEPGCFRTSIWEIDHKMAEAKVASLPAEIRARLPDDAAENVSATFRELGAAACADLNPVVDAYTHAITAKFPKKRYVVGFDANFIYRSLWLLPEYIGDFIIDRLIRIPFA